MPRIVRVPGVKVSRFTRAAMRKKSSRRKRKPQKRYVENTITHKKILVNSPTYNQLAAKGVPMVKWKKKVKPRKVPTLLPAERRRIFDLCGSKCFLDAVRLQYPICATKKMCQVDCTQVHQAKQQAIQKNNHKAHRRATRLCRKKMKKK